LFFGLLVLVACGRAEPEPPSTYRPNFLVVVVDALRADRLGVNGYSLPTTPEIDRLAAEGVNFSSAYAHSTWTKPSIATLFTSLYPGQHGLDLLEEEGDGKFLTRSLAGDFVTLAEGFQHAGYATAAVYHQLHLERRFGFGQGFDFYRHRKGAAAQGLNRHLRRWLDRRPEGPFFAYLHYMDVHWPYTRRLPDQGGLFGPIKISPHPPRGRAKLGLWFDTSATESNLEALQARYDHEVAFVDAKLGEFLAALRQRGLLEDTVVVLTSDHGEGFGEHGALLHGFAPYDEIVRVPLVVRLPAKLRRWTGTVGQPVGLIDFMPTLLDLAGIEPPPGIQGRSLRSLLEGEELQDRLVFAESVEAIAVWGRRYKLLRFTDGRQEFYDLETDPHEQTPVIGDCLGPCAELARSLDLYIRAMTRVRAELMGKTIRLRPRELERLEALGYL
jgi:arylsulfatase A-like enzyme